MSQEKMNKLIEKIKNNPSLALKLGLVEGSSKEMKKCSPIKLKKVVLNLEKNNKSNLQENAQETEASTSKSVPNDPEIEMEDNGNSDYEQNFDSEDELDQLDNILSNEVEDENDDPISEEFAVISGPEKANWVPNKKALIFFLEGCRYRT